MIVIMVALCAFCSLGVDFGRVQIVKTELRRAADASARAAGSQMKLGKSYAVNKAIEYAALNKADGLPVVLDSSKDIEFGTWNAELKKVQGHQLQRHQLVQRCARRGAARCLARHIGADDVRPRARSEFMRCGSRNHRAGHLRRQHRRRCSRHRQPVSGRHARGQHREREQSAQEPGLRRHALQSAQSPWQVNLPFSDGDKLNFDSISGDARHDPNLADYAPDGQLDDIGTNTAGAENGISNLRAPINALVGVFLTDDKPNMTSCPLDARFHNRASRNFKSLSPKLKQLFFIGDGHPKDGGKQDFIVPAGATRLFLATWDFFEWNNNSGPRVKVSRPDQIMTVK